MILATPTAEQQIVYSSPRDENLKFDFNIESVMFDRDEGDLVLRFFNGGTIVVQNYFAQDDIDAFPPIELETG